MKSNPSDDSPAASRADTAWALGLAALLGTAGVGHFVRPEFFDPLVPSWMPISARATTYLSGVAELASATLLAVPGTRRLGGWVALATFVGVFPANIQAALDGGMEQAAPPWNSAAAAWGRLPFQLPMIYGAWRVARSVHPVDAADG